MTKASSDYEKDKSNLENMVQQVSALEKQKAALKYDADEHNTLTEQQQQLQRRLEELNVAYKQLCDQ